MTDGAIESRSVVVERDIPHPVEKIWRALTQPQLIEEWLMKNDFEPVLDHKFNLRGDWGAVDCRVLQIQPLRTGLPMGSKALSPGRSPRRAKVRICGWSSRAFGRIRNRPTGAPRWVGEASSPSWSRSWRGRIDALGHSSGSRIPACVVKM
jgi:Activator of Hsp90 ATPase homolog 1-like protein